MPISRTSRAIAPVSSPANVVEHRPPPSTAGASARESTGLLCGLQGRGKAAEPRVEVGRTRGSDQGRAQVKGTDKQTAQALQKHAFGRDTGIVAATPATPLRPGSSVQHARTRDGTALHVAIGSDGVSAVPSFDPVHEPVETKSRSRLRRLVAPLLDRLPDRKAGMRASLALADEGLRQLPSHLVTQVAASRSGTLFGIGPDGGLYRFDEAGNGWSPADEEGGQSYAQIGPQRDGQLYAARAAEAGGAEILRLDGDEAELLHVSERPIASYSVGGDGSLLTLDDRGRLTIARGDQEASAGLALVGSDGQPIEAEGAPTPVAIAWAGDESAHVAGSDGRLYRLDLSRSPGPKAFAAQQVANPFEGRPELDRDSTLVDFGHTVDPESGEPTLHALFRRPSGEVFSAYHADSGFKPGWRFDNAFVAQNRVGMQPIRIAPRDTVALDRDGVQLALKRGQLHVGHAGGHWQPMGVPGLSSLKANPSGLGRSYALQTERQPDGSSVKRLLRIELEGLHPQLPPGTAPRPGTIDGPVEARLGELAKGAVRDFAVLESLGSSAGDETKRLFYVDDDNRLFTRDLNGSGPAEALALPDVGRLDQIALDAAGQLFAIARREDEPPRLYQLQGQDWVAQDLPLAPGHTLSGIESNWTGRLQVRIEPPAGQGESATYLYSPQTGLAPLDRQGAIDALRAAGGREFHLPGLPAAHVKAEFLGFKSTSRPVLSNTVNWFQSAWAHTRSLASAPKVGARWVQHKRHGREGLQPLYQGTSATSAWYRAHLGRGAATQPPTGLQDHLARIATQDAGLADEMQAFTESLMRSSRQMLQHIGHATGFLDANLADDRGFKSHKPKSVDEDHDLLDDLHRWFGVFAGSNDSAEAQQALGLLQRMRHSPERLYLRQPDAQGQGRSSKDGELLLNTRILRNLQAVHELQALLTTEDIGDDLRARFEALRRGHAEDPVTQYSSLAFKNTEQLEDTYDIVRSMGRMLNNWRHPLNRTVAESYGVPSPGRRRAELIDAAEHNRVDPNLLAHYGAPDAATLAWWLKDARLPQHAPLVAQLKDESLQELKQRFADTLMAMKTKETYVLDRSYGGGIDPLGYVNNKNGVFAFAGGLLGRDYNLSVEILGDDPRGGELGILIEKARDASVEIAAGWGKSEGKGHGFLHHFMRGAVIGEIGVRHTRSGGMQFMVPRDRVPEFVDRLFDFGKKGEGELKDLQGLLAPTYERETVARRETAVEAKAQGFFRMGPNGYKEDAGGHFWAARPSIFHAGVGIGFEKTRYEIHGQTLDGELQAGAERHEYWQREADLRLPGLRFRSWFNFPRSEEAEQQFSLGFGNTDSELTLGVHDKGGAKCEYRAAVPQPVQPAQWAELLQGAAAAFPEQAERLAGLQAWADEPASFAARLGELRGEVAGAWDEGGGAKKDLVANLDLMRWQHGLAMAGKPMHFGVIHELRASNPSRLTEPAIWTKLGEKVYGDADAAGHPLRDMQARLSEDPTLRQLMTDLQATHPGRVKIKLELKPEAMDRLVQMQLAYPNLPESRVAEFIRDPKNFRINTIAALKSSDVSNSASVWPVIGITSGASTAVEELTGSVHFDYDTDGQPTGYRLDGAFARQRKSVQQPRAAMAATGREPVTLPSSQRLPVGEAPSTTTPTTGASSEFEDARSEFARPTLAELFESDPIQAERIGSTRSEYFDAESNPGDDEEPAPAAAEHKRRGFGTRLRGLFR
jgi:hypothetical protein